MALTLDDVKRDSRHVMTPLMLEILLHYYYSRSDIDGISYQAQDLALRELELDLGLLKSNALIPGRPRQSEARFEVTDKGRVYVQMLLATPLPIWADPRKLPAGSTLHIEDERPAFLRKVMD